MHGMAPLLLLLFFFPMSARSHSLVHHHHHHHHASLSLSLSLSRLYNNSAFLDDHQVTFFWTLHLHLSSISFAAQAARKSDYLAIGFGDSMKDSYAYVAWTDPDTHIARCHVQSYWISARDASQVHLTQENLTDVRCQSQNGILSFELTRSLDLDPACTGTIECGNVIDPTRPLRVIWAMGWEWSGTHLSDKNMHFAMSDSAEPVFLLSSLAKEERNLAITLAVHGVLMFISWGILFPGGVLSARFLKHASGHDLWFRLHQYLQYSGLAITITALVIAVTALGEFDISSGHAKFGSVAVLLCVSQPINAYFRPRKAETTTGETGSDKRVIWEYAHAITGRVSLVLGMVGLFTGLKHFGEEHDSEIAERLTWGLVLWILISVSLVLYLEFKELRRRRRERNFAEANWELGELELELELDDDELVDLLEASPEER